MRTVNAINEIYATQYRIEFRTSTRHVLESDFTPKRTLLLACMSMGYELKFSHSGQGGILGSKTRQRDIAVVSFSLILDID